MIFQQTCRRSYCPAGEFLIGCRCIQPLQVYGMPVLLTIKVIPISGHVTTPAKKETQMYQSTLNETLHTISLSIVLIRSQPGQDTKKTMKPFLDSLADDKKLEMHFKQMTYLVKLTSRIRLWTEIDASSSDIEIHPYLVDLD